MNSMINPLLISSRYLAETTVDVTSEIIGSKGGEVTRQTPNVKVIHRSFFKATNTIYDILLGSTFLYHPYCWRLKDN